MGLVVDFLPPSVEANRRTRFMERVRRFAFVWGLLFVVSGWLFVLGALS